MKHKRFFIAAVSSTIVFWSLGSAAKTVVEMKDAQGKSVGTVTIVESGTGEKGAGVGLDLDLHDLPPGRHGIHFHQNAKCDGPDFKSAGPHFNPDGKKHGLQNPDGHHAGDMMNFSVNEQGAAKLKLTDDDVAPWRWHQYPLVVQQWRNGAGHPCQGRRYEDRSFGKLG